MTTAKTSTPTCDWTGASGTRYAYFVYSRGTKFNAVPGDYIFAKKNAAGLWVAVYIGETEDLSTRFGNHHQLPCVDRNGATHLHVHVNRQGQQARLNEETDLRRRYNPSCNEQ